MFSNFRQQESFEKLDPKLILPQAAQNWHDKIVNLLIKAKANMSVTNLQGKTPLHLLADREVTEKMIEETPNTKKVGYASAKKLIILGMKKGFLLDSNLEL